MNDGERGQGDFAGGRRAAGCALVLLLGALVACQPGPLTPLPPASTPALTTPASALLLLSDLHFDPFADAALVTRLRGTEASGWRAVFEGAAPAALSRRGQDTNYPLLKSALDAAAAGPKPAFVVILGDFLAHHFEIRYATATGDRSPEGLFAFVDKTVAFLAAEISSRFPDPPIFPALGNNDSSGGDYSVEPGGPFLLAMARAFEPLANRRLVTGDPPGRGRERFAAPDFAASFAAWGHYTATLPIERPTTLVVLDSVLWSAHRRGASCAPASGDAGAAEIAWLRRSLEAARATGASVWLAAHIPPGIDVPTTVSAGAACPLAPVPFYAAGCTPEFLEVVAENAGIIALSLGGHTHADDFRALPGRGGAPIIPHKVVPSISPVFGNAPAFLTMSFDRGTGAIRDYTVTALADPAGAASHTPGAWQVEYQFASAYQEPGLTGASLAAVVAAISRGGAAGEAYRRRYNAGGSANAVTTGSAKAFACGMETFTAEAFTACACPP